MAVKTRDEILESFKARLGEKPDGESISFLEDFRSEERRVGKECRL